VQVTETTCQWWGQACESPLPTSNNPIMRRSQTTTTNALSQFHVATNKRQRPPANITQTYIKLSFRRTIMDILDGATSLHSDMSEDAQRWIETASNRTRSKSPASQTSLHNNIERSTCPQHPETPKSPPPLPTMNTSALLQESHNAFEESFTAALANPPIAYDGHFDREEDYDDQTPLLNSYHKPSQAPQEAPYQPSRHAPLEPPSKSKPSRTVCLWNEVSHNSQYTRPAADILREVLEVRYPVATVGAGYERLHESRESQGLLDWGQGRGRRRWWNRLLRRRATG
jgi:hypothetical protein